MTVLFWLALALGFTVGLSVALWRGRFEPWRRLARRSRFGETPHQRAAEQRARELLRSCLTDAEWAMYRDLGFLRVTGRRRRFSAAPQRAQTARGSDYAYLVYPNKPIVSYLPATGRLLSEYDLGMADDGPGEPSQLSNSDDVLVKWMGLTDDERGLLGRAAVHPPGRELDCRKVRRDLWRLAVWERSTGSGFDVVESPPL